MDKPQTPRGQPPPDNLPRRHAGEEPGKTPGTAEGEDEFQKPPLEQTEERPERADEEPRGPSQAI
jgi:hypothetical protein